jgi:hypothetical protein
MVRDRSFGSQLFVARVCGFILSLHLAINTSYPFLFFFNFFGILFRAALRSDGISACTALFWYLA